MHSLLLLLSVCNIPSCSAPFYIGTVPDVKIPEMANKELEGEGRLSGAQTLTHEGVLWQSALERCAVQLCVRLVVSKQNSHRTTATPCTFPLVFYRGTVITD